MQDLRTLHLPANTVGRDFVCGDLHGSFSCLTRFMAEVKFDRTVDRFICVGDLVDRGPRNEECLALLYEPWFYSVYANHEELAVHFMTGDWLAASWMGNGGTWALPYFQPNALETDDERIMREFVIETLRDKVASLPHVITVDKRDGSRFHVLHAELPKVVGITDAVLADPQSAEKHVMKRRMDGTTNILWSRNLFYHLARQPLDDATVLRKAVRHAEHSNYHVMFSPELSPIYSGHTVLRQPCRFYGQTNLDTMAYGSYIDGAPSWCGLTVTEPETDRFWFVNENEFKEVDVFVVA